MKSSCFMDWKAKTNIYIYIWKKTFTIFLCVYIYIVYTPSIKHLYILYTLLCVDKYAILQVELRDGCWIF